MRSRLCKKESKLVDVALMRRQITEEIELWFPVFAFADGKEFDEDSLESVELDSILRSRLRSQIVEGLRERMVWKDLSASPKQIERFLQRKSGEIDLAIDLMISKSVVDLERVLESLE
jgi:hypothetical protein